MKRELPNLSKTLWEAYRCIATAESLEGVNREDKDKLADDLLAIFEWFTRDCETCYLKADWKK